MPTGPGIATRLIEQGRFAGAFVELQRTGDRGLYAELLSGTTWSAGRGAGAGGAGGGDHVSGAFHPGRAFGRKGLHRGALDALMLFLVTEAEGPVAAELRDSAVSLRLAHSGWEGGTNLERLGLLPNLRALGLEGVTVNGDLPALKLDQLELVSAAGITGDWLERVAPSDFWTDANDIPRSVVRLRIGGTTGPRPPVRDLPLLEDLQAFWTTLQVRDCPRLRQVRSTGPLDLAVLATWTNLPQLASLCAEGAFAWNRPPVSLPEMPKLRTLVLDGFVELLSIPPSVTHFGASLMNLAPVAALDAPVELRVPRAGGNGELPPIRDSSKLAVLDLSGRAVSETSLETIGCFPALRRLHLRGAPITSLRALQGHPSLEVVDISDCSLLRDIHALGTLPNLKVTLMAGTCGMTPADLPAGVEWTANRQEGPNIDVLLQRERPRLQPRRFPRGLPKSAERLFHDVFPLMLRRDYDSIDVAIDEFAHAEIPEVWDWWLDGVGLPAGSAGAASAQLCPRRMSQTQQDQPFARHAALRLIGLAPESCEIAARFRLRTTLRSRFQSGPAGCFDISLLTGLPHLESVVVGCNELKLPGSPHPDWVPRLTSLHVVSYRPGPEDFRAIEQRLRAALPHVPDIIVR